MYCGLKNVYFLFFVRKPRSSARLKSDMALFRKPACLASSRDMRVKISATVDIINNKSGQHTGRNFHTSANGPTPVGSREVIWGAKRAALHDSIILTSVVKHTSQFNKIARTVARKCFEFLQVSHDTNVQNEL